MIFIINYVYYGWNVFVYENKLFYLIRKLTILCKLCVVYLSVYLHVRDSVCACTSMFVCLYYVAEKNWETNLFNYSKKLEQILLKFSQQNFRRHCCSLLTHFKPRNDKWWCSSKFWHTILKLRIFTSNVKYGSKCALTLILAYNRRLWLTERDLFSSETCQHKLVTFNYLVTKSQGESCTEY